MVDMVCDSFSRVLVVCVLFGLVVKFFSQVMFVLDRLLVEFSVVLCRNSVLVVSGLFVWVLVMVVKRFVV